MNALMFLWVVNVFYLSPGRNVLAPSASSLTHELEVLQKNFSTPSHSSDLQFLSNNSSSRTDSGIASQLLQFITSIVMKADISRNLHVSASSFPCVAVNTTSLLPLSGSSNHHRQAAFQFG